MTIFSTSLSIVVLFQPVIQRVTSGQKQPTGWVRKGMHVNTVSFVCVCVYPPFSPIIQGLFGNIFVVPPSQFFMTFAPFFPFTPMTGNVHKDRQNHSEWEFSPKTLNRHAYTQTEHVLKWKFKQAIRTYCINIQESALHNMYCVYVCILWDPTCSLSQWTQFDPPDSNIVFS